MSRNLPGRRRFCDEAVKNIIYSILLQSIWKTRNPTPARARAYPRGWARGWRRGHLYKPLHGLALAELHNKIFIPPVRDMRRIRPRTLYIYERTHGPPCSPTPIPETLRRPARRIISVLNLRFQFRPFHNSRRVYNINKYIYKRERCLYMQQSLLVVDVAAVELISLE